MGQGTGRRGQRQSLRGMRKRLAEIEREDRERAMGAYAPRPSLGAKVSRVLGRLLRVAVVVVAVALVVGVGLWVVDPDLDGTGARDRIRDLVPSDEEGAYALLIVSRNGEATGWDPCEPIRYVVNPEGAPDGWQADVETAVSATAEASGYEFEDAGTTEARPLDEADVIRGAPLLIAWADEAEVPALADRRLAVGFTNPLVRRSRSYFVSGVVVVNTAAYDGVDVPSAEADRPFVLEHELGHMLGLAHVDDPDELMNADYVGLHGFGPGDERGLREVHDIPCP